MKLPRNEAEYRAIRVLFGNETRLSDFLDQAVTMVNEMPADISMAERFEHALDQDFREEDNGHVYDHISLSDSEHSRLRLAMFFWNSRDVGIKSGDILCLDHENRRLFVKALLTWLETFGGSGLASTTVAGVMGEALGGP